MFAVILSGGKQYRVEVGQTLKLESLPALVGDTVTFEKVLMVANGDDIKIGSPFLASAAVSATVVEHGRGPKIRIVKHRRRKHYHKEMGHRQNYTAVKITEI
ncbi:MAG: 50S ribosomal protein L21 [Gammaproteobacteria bacterium]|nr:50S ribosomal protein L21 [Gammaproteobacteria bacterium]